MSSPNPEATINPQAAGLVPPPDSTHPPCRFFTEVYGEGLTDPAEVADLLAEFATDPEYSGTLAHTVVENAIAVEGWSAPPEDPRLPARRAYDAVACGTCVLSKICPSKTEFEATAETEEAARLMAMFHESPLWLKRARLHAIKMTENEFNAIMKSEETLAAAILNGFSIANLVGDVRSRPVQPLSRDQLPQELADELTSAKTVDSFPTDLIEIEGCNYAIKVTDMTAVNGYKGAKPNEKDFGILIDKGVRGMRDVDSRLRPQLVNASLQKVVRTFSGGFVAEIRNSGKRRMYIGVQVEPVNDPSVPGKPTYQAYMFGAHDNNRALQDRFYQETGILNLPRV